MVHHGNNSCFNALLGLGTLQDGRESAATRRLIDEVLSCDKMVRCSQRLECTWLASQLATASRRK